GSGYVEDFPQPPPAGPGPVGSHREALPARGYRRGRGHEDQEVRRLSPDRRRYRGSAAYFGAGLGARRAHRGRRPGRPEAEGAGAPGGPEPPPDQSLAEASGGTAGRWPPRGDG